MIGMRNWRSGLVLAAGAVACLLLGSDGGPLGVDVSEAGTKIKASKVNSLRILAGGLGTPTDVAMVNQVVPRISPYSNPVIPLVDVIARTDLLVTTTNNLSGLSPVGSFPPGALVRVRRPLFPTSKYAPPDNNGDGISDNVTVFSENNGNFIGSPAVVVSPGANGVSNTNRAGDDDFVGNTIVVGANGVPESGLCGDDVLAVPFGTSGLAPNTPVVTAGPNGVLESNPADKGLFWDDVAWPDLGCPMNTLCAGANGVAQSGLGGDDVQGFPCVGRHLDPLAVIVEGGGTDRLVDGNRLLETLPTGDDTPAIIAAQDQGNFGAPNFDSDTTACQLPDGTPIGGCDDVQLVAAGTPVAGKNVAVVGPGANGVLETPPNSFLYAGGDFDADTTACQELDGTPVAGPCDDVQLVPAGTGGLAFDTPVIGPGPDLVLQSRTRFFTFLNRDLASFDAGALQAGVNQVAESGPPDGDDVAVVQASLISPNQTVPPLYAPIGVETVVSMYPAVASLGDPMGDPTNAGSVAFLSGGAFSIGSNGLFPPRGDTKALGVGLAMLGVDNLGVIAGKEGAREGSQGLLSGLAGFVYGGFGWTDISFKKGNDPLLPPALKDHVYYATRLDGGIVLVHYLRQRVNDVLAPGVLDAPTALAYLGPARSLCIGINLDGGAGIAARCGAQDPPGAFAGRLYVIESGTGRIAVVPLEIANTPADSGLCVSPVGLAVGKNDDSAQGPFCNPTSGLPLDGGSCDGGSPITQGRCVTEGVGLPNTRIVADAGGITYLSSPFLTDPVAIAMFTTLPVPHIGQITSGSDGITDSAVSGDDVQEVPVGQGFPDARAIDAPPILNNFNLQTTPQGDDVVIGGVTTVLPQIPGGLPATTVTSGPDGIVDTAKCNPNPPGSCTDIQLIPVGRGESFQRVISAGANAVLDTTPSGDDRVMRSPTLLVANRGGTVVWMDLNGADPVTHTGVPRFFDTKLTNITGMSIGNFVDGEGFQVLLTTTDHGGAVVAFDPTLADNSEAVVADLRLLTDLSDTVSAKLDTSLIPIALPPTTIPTGLTHVGLDYYPGPDGIIGTPDDPHFDNPPSLSHLSNISESGLSEPNEVSVDGTGGNIYATLGGRVKNAPGGAFSVNTLNAPFDAILDGDPTVDLYNFISGNIFIHVGRFPKQPNAILAGPDRVVQTTACEMPDGTPITPCDDLQLTLAGDGVFPGPRGMRILPGANGVAESGLGGDDVQAVPVGTTFSTPGFTPGGAFYQVWTTNVVGVTAGPDGVLDTCPGGDDTVGAGSAGILANCPGVVANLADCPTDFRKLGLGCTVPTPACPVNALCTGPNGVVNSGLALDDLQLVAPFTTALAATTPVVGPGADEFIETSPGGDDLLGGGAPMDVVIQPGPDNILQTPVASGDVLGRLTPISIQDLDIYAYSRSIVTLDTPSQIYAFLPPEGRGINSGVVDIGIGKTSNALDAAVDAIFPNSSTFFGPSMDSPTGEIDFYARDISVTAAIDNVTGLVFGRSVEGNAQLPALSLVYLDAELVPVNNAFVGSLIVGRQIVRAPGRTFEPDVSVKNAKKKKKSKKKKAKSRKKHNN
jgi:hypothetical protein